MKFIYVFIFAFLLSTQAMAELSFDAGVSVNAQAQSSSEAKKIAMNKAHREAFIKVGSRFISAQNIKQLDALTDDQILHFIREVEVVSEKSTSNTYMADFNIKINENLLRQYLEENSLLYSGEKPSKVLIIPVFSDTEYREKVLFEDGNIWRNTWLEKGEIKSGVFDFETIQNTQDNTLIMTSANFDSLDKETYERLRISNGIENVFIINALRAGANTLVINIKSYPKKMQKSFVVNDENVFEKAIEQAVSHITKFMQNKIINQEHTQTNIEIVSDLKLKEWLEVEKELNKITEIKKVELKTFGINRVVFTMEFSGNFDALITLLAKKGLYIQLIDGYNVLTR